ncbi:hypothetical protein [Vineibacter terrae]|uniref:hypothetical protein n=1 Tax=Vineibacter terrae TaxID=2586908 RepID=UPI002E37A39A|nr:hypothetical protein [Vineibacter terrae]HEX2887610.1 hypothetical protein [Vineibacter terrae]
MAAGARATAHRVGGIAGSMSIEDPVHQSGHPRARFGYDPWFTERYVRYFGRLNPMLPRKATLPVGTTVSTSMLMPPDEFARTDYYNDWVRPQLAARYAGFDHESLPLAAGSKARLADFASITDGFRTPFAAAGTDRP